MQANLLDNLFRGVRRSVPLVGVTTSDPHAVISLATKFITDEFKQRDDVEIGPMVQWDVMRGFTPLNEAGGAWILQNSTSNDHQGEFAALDSQVGSLAEGDVVKFLDLCNKLPDFSVVFFHNAHRWLVGDDNISKMACQGVSNLRNEFKANHRMLVMLAPQITYPAEVRPDIMAFDDPLPSQEELQEIVRKGHRPRTQDKVTEIKITTEQEMRIAGTLAGLSNFAAEQAIALTLTSKGADIEKLRTLRRSIINQTPGLKVYAGKESFNDVAGVDYIKTFMKRLFNGKNPPNLIVHIDEIEKAMAGVEGDTSGTSQDQLGTLLQDMEDNNSRGLIAYGPPGCTKSMLCKTAGNTFGVDTIKLDLGATKGSLVGQSENQIRDALKVINAMSGGNAYFIATSNKLSINSALMRRFTHGIVFFDLPDEKEQAEIWKVQIKAFGLEKKQSAKIPPAAGWSAAEIRNCCEIASSFNCTLLEAAAEIIPVSASDPSAISEPRAKAAGKFKSASHGGVYQPPKKDVKPSVPVGRGFTNLDD